MMKQAYSRYISSLLLAVVLLVFSNSSIAEYVGISAGQATLKRTGGSDATELAYKVYGAFKVMDKYDVELAYISLGSYLNDTVAISGLAAYLLGIHSLSSQFTVHGKIGIMNWQVDYETSGTTSKEIDYTYGAGLSYMYQPNIFLSVEWELYHAVGEAGSTPGSDMELLSAGVRYQF